MLVGGARGLTACRTRDRRRPWRPRGSSPYHPGQIGLITVSIGGNDILGCAAATIFISCLMNAVGQRLQDSLRQLLVGVRAAGRTRRFPSLASDLPPRLPGSVSVKGSYSRSGLAPVLRPRGSRTS